METYDSSHNQGFESLKTREGESRSKSHVVVILPDN